MATDSEAQAVADELEPGEIVSGRFVVSSPIGSGGMGKIYLAHQRPFNRPVALKVMHRKASKNRELVERFFQEGNTVSHLAHPNTVTVFDFGRTEAGLLYIAMELIDGVSLADEIRNRGTLPAEEAIPFTIQIAQSLGEAHFKGLIHRDLKPDNVMVCRPEGSDAFVKVLDFGIAKVLSKQEGWTEVGNIVGTPHYMAPEQAKSREIDGRTDLYSLGCCLFEMLTGKPPFPSGSPVEVLMAHQNEEPPSLPAGFDDSLDDFLKRVLAKNPEDRPRDAATFVAELLATVIQMRGSSSYSGYTPTPDELRIPQTPVSRTIDTIDDPPPKPLGNADTLDAPRPPEPRTPGLEPKYFAIVAVGLLLAFFAGRMLAQGGGASSAAAGEVTAGSAATTAEPTSVTVNSEPKGALVILDGTPVGKTPLERPIEPGTPLRLEMRGFEDFETTVSPEAGEVFAPLNRARLKVRVTSPFEGTKVFIGDDEYGVLHVDSERVFEIAHPTEDLVVWLEAPGYKRHMERRDAEILESPVVISPAAKSFTASGQNPK